MEMKLSFEGTERLRPALQIALALQVFLVLFLLWDWHARRPTAEQEIRTGRVAARDTTYVGPLSRPVLTVQVDGQPGTTFKSILDVQLLEETSSLTLALLGVAVLVFSSLLLLGIPAAPTKRAW